MKLKVVRTNFTQFSSGLRVRAEDGDSRLECALRLEELHDFLLMLLDIADDCLAKLGDEYSEAKEKLDDAVSTASAAHRAPR